MSTIYRELTTIDSWAPDGDGPYREAEERLLSQRGWYLFQLRRLRADADAVRPEMPEKYAMRKLLPSDAAQEWRKLELILDSCAELFAEWAETGVRPT